MFHNHEFEATLLSLEILLFCYLQIANNNTYLFHFENFKLKTKTSVNYFSEFSELQAELRIAKIDCTFSFCSICSGH